MNWIWINGMKLVAIVLLSLGGIKVGKAEPVADRCNINAALIFHQEIRLSQEYKKNLNLDLEQYIPTFTKILEYYPDFEEMEPGEDEKPPAKGPKVRVTRSKVRDMGSKVNIKVWEIQS